MKVIGETVDMDGVCVILTREEYMALASLVRDDRKMTDWPDIGSLLKKLAWIANLLRFKKL